jgi:hypothetical protein
MAVFRLQVSSKASILEELLVSFTDLHTPLHPGIVSSGPRDYGHREFCLLETADLRPSGPKLPAGHEKRVVDTSKYDLRG